MKSYAVTYTFVVEADDSTSISQAVEEYVANNSDVFSDPVEIEELWYQGEVL